MTMYKVPKTSAFVTKANQVIASGKLVDNLFIDMSLAVSQSYTYWEGEAAEHHRKGMQGHSSKAKEIIVRLKEHAEKLKAISEGYESGESQVSASLSQLPRDVIK